MITTMNHFIKIIYLCIDLYMVQDDEKVVVAVVVENVVVVKFELKKKWGWGIKSPFSSGELLFLFTTCCSQDVTIFSVGHIRLH